MVFTYAPNNVILLCQVAVALWNLWTHVQVMMNSMNVPSKRSTLERKLDKLILGNRHLELVIWLQIYNCQQRTQVLSSLMIAVFPLMQNHLTCIIFLLPYNDLLLVSAGEVQCEQPNNSLYTFTGNLIIEKQTLPLSPNQLLLRVCFDLHFFNSEQLIYLPSSFLLKGHQQLIRL